jgi:hypothetical protein
MVFPNPFRALAALFRVVRAYWLGDETFVSGRILQFRRQKCNMCFHRDAETDQCRLCTCFLSLKTQLSTEKCPLTKW